MTGGKRWVIWAVALEGTSVSISSVPGPRRGSICVFIGQSGYSEAGKFVWMQDSGQHFTHISKGRLFGIAGTWLLSPSDFCQKRMAIRKFVSAPKVRELVNEFLLHTLLIANWRFAALRTSYWSEEIGIKAITYIKFRKKPACSSPSVLLKRQKPKVGEMWKVSLARN